MKILIITQYSENYGAHDWDGVGECLQYWKCKPSTAYEIQNLSLEEAEEIITQKHADFVKLLTCSNDYISQTLIGMSIHEDDEVISDPWEHNTVLELKDNKWHYTYLNVNDEYGYLNKHIAEIKRTGILEENNETSNDVAVYKLQNGTYVTPAEFNDFVKEYESTSPEI